MVFVSCLFSLHSTIYLKAAWVTADYCLRFVVVEVYPKSAIGTLVAATNLLPDAGVVFMNVRLHLMAALVAGRVWWGFEL